MTALIGPSGCGKSTFLRILNRMHEMTPSAADGRRGAARRRATCTTRSGGSPRCAASIGMVFQKPNPFPAMSIYDNVLAGLKLTGSRADQDTKDALVARLPGQGRPLERGARPAAPARRRALRRPAAAALHRAGARGAAPGAAHGRAVLGPRPHLDPSHRAHDRGAALGGHDRDRDPQHAAGGPRVRLLRLLPRRAEQPGYIIEHGPTDAMFGAPQDPRTLDYVHGRFGWPNGPIWLGLPLILIMSIDSVDNGRNATRALRRAGVMTDSSSFGKHAGRARRRTSPTRSRRSTSTSTTSPRAETISSGPSPKRAAARRGRSSR